MNMILLSGGSGKRLWPLSNDVRSKQFIKFFQGEEGETESMLQRVYRQIQKADPNVSVTIATSKAQASMIRNQLGAHVGLSLEPCRKDTFPAIALATAYLYDVKNVQEEEVVMVCPIDPYVEDGYFETLRKVGEQASRGEANLVLMGIEPTYPSEKYGYIIPETTEKVAKVKTFQEKPDAKTAQAYIAEGALWNGGVFAYKLKYMLEKAHELIAFKDYADLYSRYGELEKISFDYAVAEHEPNIQVVRFEGAWKDLGTWNTLTETMDAPVLGDAFLDGTCENVHVINELDIPVLCMGLKDMVVAAGPDGILVSDKVQSSFMKPYVDKLDGPIRYAEKSWGSFQILDIEEESLTIKVTLNPGERMNYHSHERRDEVWSIISGKGKVIVDDMEQMVSAGDVITMQAGCRHTIIAQTVLKLLEVQLGKEISVHDKQKFEWE